MKIGNLEIWWQDGKEFGLGYGSLHFHIEHCPYI